MGLYESLVGIIHVPPGVEKLISKHNELIDNTDLEDFPPAMVKRLKHYGIEHGDYIEVENGWVTVNLEMATERPDTYHLSEDVIEVSKIPKNVKFIGIDWR